MKPAIRVEGLSKQYRIGTRTRGAARNLTESIVDGASALWRRLTRRRSVSGTREFWALKDVSFEVQPGEVVGIIGRNGAGKSTLLKVLSRIVEPTSGRAEVRGRMSSLLEVGTGFHPELTGCENIYLNGSILGMSRREIAQKFDEIVAFAEIEPFLDTPVKRFSSGMYVRLAFAVAAHLEPEVLVVDEVLAVGDAQFQSKCVGKMDQIGRSGRTVLFVSHNMPMIKAHCTKALGLRAGQIVDSGSVESVVNRYLAEGLDATKTGFNRIRRVFQSDECEIVDAWLSYEGTTVDEVKWEQPFEINLEIVVSSRVRLWPDFVIRDGRQNPILLAATGAFQGFRRLLDPGRYRISARCPGLQLAGGSYFLDVAIAESNARYFDYYECGLSFSVDDLPRPPHGWCFRQDRGQGCLPLAVATVITDQAGLELADV